MATPTADRIVLQIPWETVDGADHVHVEPKSRRVFIHRADSAHVTVLDGWTGEELDAWPIDFETLPGAETNDAVVINLVRNLIRERLTAGY